MKIVIAAALALALAATAAAQDRSVFQGYAPQFCAFMTVSDGKVSVDEGCLNRAAEFCQKMQASKTGLPCDQFDLIAYAIREIRAGRAEVK